MTDTTDADYGRLTDESFERSRARIGVPVRLPNTPHNLEVSRDGLRHFAYGYGDDNPLYCDEDHAAGHALGRARRAARVPLHDGRGRVAAAAAAREQGDAPG